MRKESALDSNFHLRGLAPLPEWHINEWLNTPDPISLSDLKGKVVAIYAFQMLCPACISDAIPQAKELRQTFSPNDLVVIGLHTVFEHHSAMSEVSLRAFLKEYQVNFPVGIDQPSDSGIPVTMETYNLQGTPTLLLVDKQGRLRRHHFGTTSNLQLGAEIMELALS